MMTHLNHKYPGTCLLENIIELRKTLNQSSSYLLTTLKKKNSMMVGDMSTKRF